MEPDGASTTYTYDEDNNRNVVSYPNGVTIDYDTNKSNSVTKVLAKKAGGSTYVNLEYDYDLNGDGTDDMGLRSQVRDVVAGTTTKYTYDVAASAQLKKAETSDTSTGNITKTYTYNYDANGNRMSSNVDGGAGTDYDYNRAGEMTRAGSSSYAYDANGNVLSGGGLLLVYNDRNQTVSANGTAVSYADQGQSERTAFGTTSYTTTPLGRHGDHHARWADIGAPGGERAAGGTPATHRREVLPAQRRARLHHRAH